MLNRLMDVKTDQMEVVHGQGVAVLWLLEKDEVQSMYF